MKRIASLALMLAASPALAHHPLNGLPMETFAHGALSGVGHPVLGVDHLMFVLAVGIAAGVLGRPFAAPLAYLAAMLVGCIAVLSGAVVPLQEPLIALSLLVVGGLIAFGTPSPGRLLALFAGFGLFHGAAFGGSVVGTEAALSRPVIAGYLIGLGVVQYAMAIAAGAFTRQISIGSARLGGAMVAGAGALLCFEIAEPALLALLIG